MVKWSRKTYSSQENGYWSMNAKQKKVANGKLNT